MRRRRNSVCALSCIALGLIIFLGVLLPGEFWWLMLSVGLLGCGIWMLRCC